MTGTYRYHSISYHHDGAAITLLYSTDKRERVETVIIPKDTLAHMVSDAASVLVKHMKEA